MTPRHVISYWVWLREMDIWEGLFDEMEWSFRVFYVIRILRQLWADILKGEKRNLIFYSLLMTSYFILLYRPPLSLSSLYPSAFSSSHSGITFFGPSKLGNCFTQKRPPGPHNMIFSPFPSSFFNLNSSLNISGILDSHRLGIVGFCESGSSSGGSS